MTSVSKPIMYFADIDLFVLSELCDLCMVVAFSVSG